MTAEDRVKTVANLGFTERQARFLVLVMRHAEICVPRQYAAFAGTAYGRRVNALFDSLVERGYATSAAACTTERAFITCVITRSIAPSVNLIAGTVARCRQRPSASA
jgi:hypothetical protein